MPQASLSPGTSSEPSVSIRAAEPRDLEFVRALCKRVFLVYGSYDQYVADWFSSGEVATYVAERDGIAMGFCMLRIHAARPEEPPVAELLAIAVVPELQSRGVGGALLERCFAVALESEPAAAEIRLSVAEGNARAQRMFARNGFRIQPASGVYPAGQRALFMVKPLKAAQARC